MSLAAAAAAAAASQQTSSVAAAAPAPNYEHRNSRFKSCFESILQEKFELYYRFK